ncbi:Site-specific DNA recombinase [Pilibacter termitis]|uniref:Site-specific DNA recombinase n=1 Tax=Pilibacter termitis TaxID=263852 RepID=A0A1T4LS50_9ENTE|nr:recombinase family protein [Pilibacter termitis]SJZ57550.1 Site-specific DNA recombinase [Pilibacter termitis]
MNNSTLTIKEYTEVDLEQLNDITVVYCRLSQDDGNTGDSNSIINQKKILSEEIAKKRLSNPIYFIDDGISGTTIQYRPAISKAIELVEMGKVKNFLVKDLSRLARNYLDAGRLTEITFPDNNVRFIAVSDNIDSDHQTDNDANLLPLKSLFNDWYSRDTSKKIRAVKQAKAKAGEQMVSIPIYGYMKDPENSKNWITDPIASDIVRRIFNEAKSGKNLTRIAKDLEKDKIETPSRKILSFGKSPITRSYSPYGWHRGTIARILSKMEYLGHTINGKTRTKSYKDKKIIWQPKEDWLIFENTHEAIIDQDTFDIVQKMRQHKRVTSSPRFKAGHENLFAGLVFCGTCGCKHYYCAFEKNGTNLDHYKCSKYASTIDRCDNPHYIRKADLEELVLLELNSLIKQINFEEGEFLKKLEHKFKIESSKQTNKHRQKLLNDERRFEEIDQIIQRLYEDNITGKLSDERFMKMSQNYEQEQSKLKDSISAVKQELSTQESQSMDISRFMQRIQKYTNITELSVKIVNELIDKIIIHKPEGTKRNRILKIEIHYNFIGNLDK